MKTKIIIASLSLIASQYLMAAPDKSVCPTVKEIALVGIDSISYRKSDLPFYKARILMNRFGTPYQWEFNMIFTSDNATIDFADYLLQTKLNEAVMITHNDADHSYTCLYPATPGNHIEATATSFNIDS